MKFHEMRAPQLRAVHKEQTLLVLPVGACEQHGPHLPTFTDSFLVGAVADAVEDRLTEQMLQLPVMWLGASEHHLPLGATLTARTENHVTLLMDLARPLLADGFRRFLFLNGHGGNTDTIRVALRSLQREFPQALLSAADYWRLAAEEIAAICEGPAKGALHACEMEASLMLHLRPELVDLSVAVDYQEPEIDGLQNVFLARDITQSTQNGTLGYPSFATAEKGGRFFDVSVDAVVKAFRALLEQPLP